MNDFWQSLPREVDITHEDWNQYFDFWEGLPKAELTREPHRWTLGMVMRLTGILLYLGGIAWLIWHFV